MIFKASPSTNPTGRFGSNHLHRRTMAILKSQILFDAVERGDASLVRTILVSHVEINVRDKGGSTPLMRASLHGNTVIVDLLIACGMCIDAQDNSGKTALHYAAQEQHCSIVEHLIDAGANVNSQDGHGNSPLGMAVFYSKGVGETIMLLRKKGADDNLKNKYGVTPLGLAQTIVNYDILKFFKEKP